MTDQNPRPAGDADEPTARQPAVPPEPAPTPPPPAAEPEPVPAAAVPHAAPPPRPQWRDRRVSLFVVIAALLVGCLCGGFGVAAVGLIARVADRGDHVRMVERPGERWRDNRDGGAVPRPGFPGERRRQAPAQPAQPAQPAPAEPSLVAPTVSAPAPATSS
jgi:hypothetical protein